MVCIHISRRASDGRRRSKAYMLYVYLYVYMSSLHRSSPTNSNSQWYAIIITAVVWSCTFRRCVYERSWEYSWKTPTNEEKNYINNNNNNSARTLWRPKENERERDKEKRREGLSGWEREIKKDCEVTNKRYNNNNTVQLIVDLRSRTINGRNVRNVQKQCTRALVAHS